MDGLKGVTLELKQEAIAHDTLAGKYKVASIAIRLEKICKEIDAELRRQGLS